MECKGENETCYFAFLYSQRI